MTAAGVDRHLGLWCGCPLIECCHNEDTDQGDRWRVTRSDLACGSGTHLHSGSPASGYTQPWEPEDESWRDSGILASTILGLDTSPGNPACGGAP